MRLKILRMGAFAGIPSKKDAGVIYRFSRRIYHEHNFIEQMINKLKNFRPMASQFEKNAINFLARIQLGGALLGFTLIHDTP